MICKLCNRDVVDTTEHHLIPKTRHTNKKTIKNFSREQLNATVTLCSQCHKNLHANISEKDLEQHYNSLDSLASHPELSKFSSWISRKPDGTSVVFRAAKNKR